MNLSAAELNTIALALGDRIRLAERMAGGDPFRAKQWSEDATAAVALLNRVRTERASLATVAAMAIDEEADIK